MAINNRKVKLPRSVKRVIPASKKMDAGKDISQEDIKKALQKKEQKKIQDARLLGAWLFFPL